jgi:hypothetical protein
VQAPFASPHRWALKPVLRLTDLTNASLGRQDTRPRQYAAMTDAVGTPIVKFDAGGEGSRVPIQMPRLTVLAFHTAHAFEHYGNIVTYMRLKSVVPPSSEPPFGTYKPK